jgi:hypothetical protein
MLRQYRRIGPHPSNAAGSAIAVETDNGSGGTYFLIARLTCSLSDQALDVMFSSLETQLSEDIDSGADVSIKMEVPKLQIADDPSLLEDLPEEYRKSLMEWAESASPHQVITDHPYIRTRWDDETESCGWSGGGYPPPEDGWCRRPFSDHAS